MPVAVVFLLRVVVLVLLWGFVVAAIVAVRHDLFGTKPRKLRAVAVPAMPKPAAKAPAPIPATPAPAPAKAAPKARRGKARPSRVTIIEGSGKGTSAALSSLPVTIGRGSDSTIVIGDDYASTKHARLVPQGTDWVLEDVGSTNGTVLDGSKLTAAKPVYVGSKITIGRTVLELQ